MTLFDVDDTLTVGQVTRRIGEAIKRSFRHDVWVQGQIRNLSRSGRGHVYFDLIDPVPAGAAPKASIPVTLFDSNRQIVNRIITRTGNAVRIDDGVEVRIRGTVEFYTPRGQVQLNMTSIDPEFTLGRLGADRDLLLRTLRSEGVIEANRSLAFPLVPLRIALITSEGSAAHADFTEQLRASGYAFSISVVATRVQGEFAPVEIAEAIERADTLAVDVIAVVRGGGARTDLAAFDTEPVARAILACRRPVLAGIGHEVDEAVADLVAHASLKTPTACAQFLIEHLAAFDFALTERAQRLAAVALVAPAVAEAGLDACTGLLVQRAGHVLDDAQRHTTDAASTLERRVSRRISRSHEQLADLAARVRITAHHATDKALRHCTEASHRLYVDPDRRLRTEQRNLDLIEARVDAVDPVRAMRRGWSITTGPDGRVIRSIDEVAPGRQITTRLADGHVTSVVQAIDPPSNGVGPDRPDEPRPTTPDNPTGPAHDNAASPSDTHPTDPHTAERR